jgi:putative ABC transport system permease protein
MAWTRFFRRSTRDEDAAREIASYIAIETDDNIARGMTPQAAHDAAVRKFGNPTKVREEIYWMNTVRPVDTIWQDLKYAARLLKRDKGFAAAAILSLALGIGANTAIFQLLDAVRLRTLPVTDPQELAVIHFPRGSKLSGRFSSRQPFMTSTQVDELRKQRLDDVFSGMFAWSSLQLNTATGGEVRNAEALWVSGEAFDVLGVRPVIGRLIEPGDDRPGCGSPPAVLSYAYWQRAYGGSPSALGQKMRLDGSQFEIVGVTAPDFFGIEVGRRFDVAIPACADAMLPSSRGRIQSRGNFWLAVVARLQPGQTVKSANDRLIALSPAIMAASVPDGYTSEGQAQYKNNKLNARAAGSGLSDLREEFAKPLFVLLAATGLVLLIACANLANLLLARATARQREIAIRLAIGASRKRIVGQLLIESVLLALIGTLLGVVVARGLTDILVAQLAAGAGSLFLDLSWNMNVFAFTAGVAAAACLLFGLAPAVQATALAPVTALKAGGRGNSEARGRRFGLRKGLVVAQVALSLVLLIGALLFGQTLYNVLSIDAGFDQQVIQVELAHPSLQPEDQVQLQIVREDIRQRIAAAPGIDEAVLVNNAPLTGNWRNEYVFADGKPEKALANFSTVGPNFFAALGVPILKGRAFSTADSLNAAPVAVVNETFVRKFFPNQEPIGNRIWIEVAEGTPITKIEVVGVSRDTKYGDIRDAFDPVVHLPMAQNSDGRLVRILVKPRGRMDGVMATITREVGRVNPAISIEMRVIGQSVRDGLVRERLMAALSAAFGALAGLLAAIGIYGVMSYTVTRRANEIGIRLAMGASRSGVLRLVIVEAVWLVGIGLVIGAALGLGAAKAARSLLFGLQPTDPVTIAAAIALLATIGFIASYLPARRASRVDPMNVLRQE